MHSASTAIKLREWSNEFDHLMLVGYSVRYVFSLLHLFYFILIDSFLSFPFFSEAERGKGEKNCEMNGMTTARIHLNLILINETSG